MNKLPITTITSIKDIELFFYCLQANEDLAFHPDDDFKDYVVGNTGGVKAYTKKEAKTRNDLMQQAFTVCENIKEDIYNIGMKVSLACNYLKLSDDQRYAALNEEDNQEQIQCYFNDIEGALDYCDYLLELIKGKVN